MEYRLTSLEEGSNTELTARIVALERHIDPDTIRHWNQWKGSIDVRLISIDNAISRIETDVNNVDQRVDTLMRVQ